MSRHVGGSLFPSNSKEVLKLRESALGDLQVRVLESADTHALFYRATGAESFRMVASHPNGALLICLVIRQVGDSRN